MSEYTSKLALIAERKQKLFEEETKLVEKRKKEIGELAERFNGLSANDAIWVGLLQELAQALKTNSDRLKEWETQGARFLNTKKSNAKRA